MKTKIESIYIHIPFCKDRCYYCDFYSSRIKDYSHLLSQYIRALEVELIYYQKYFAEKVTTIYIGGGTPSILSKQHLLMLLNIIYKNTTLSSRYEYTFEMNPESVNNEKLKILKDYGVNRISIGIQSLNDRLLKKLNRIHTKKEALKALERVFSAGFENVNVDFLLGLTDRHQDILQEVSEILQYPIKHISAYILTLNKSSQKNIPDEIKNIEDEVIATQYELLHNFLREKGFIHYEISNYAKAGFMARHNLNYWRDGYYFGFGASAAGHYIASTGEEIRYKNISDLKTYISGINDNRSVYEEFEKIDSKTHTNEYIMLALRTVKGLSIGQLRKLLNKEECEIILKRSKRLAREGFLRITKNSISPTLKGFVLNNLLVRELML